MHFVSPALASLVLLLASQPVIGTGLPSGLGHPAQFSLVLEQFPMGLESDDFPLVLLAVEAEQALKAAGLPVVPRSDTPVAPYLHVSLVLIKQPYGFVLLTQGDLRESLPTTCTGAGPLEVSTWQRRQWQILREPVVPAAVIRKATDDALREFIRAYRGTK